MTTNIIGFLLIILALGAFALQRLYSSVPSRELKRLAARGDQLASTLYRPVAYGSSLRLLLWIIVGISLPLGVLVVVPTLPAIAGFLVLATVSFVAFVMLPSLRLTRRSARIAAWFAPSIAAVLVRMHGALDKVYELGNRHRELTHHSRMYEKEDLLHLLERQKGQADNRMLNEDLELAQRALVFGDQRAEDIALPHKDTYLVNADDNIGPVLLDRLHQHKQPSFLVYKDSQDNIVGSLAMSDAVSAKQGGRVLDLVRSDLVFVHEDFSLTHVLEVFQKTGQQSAVVINAFEEFVGLVTLSDVLQALIGETSAHEDSSYDNRHAVAGYQPQKPDETTPPSETDAAEQQPEAEQSAAPSSPEATEVIE